MNFIKGLIGFNKEEELSSKLSAYIGQGRFCTTGKEKECIFAKGSIDFLENKQKSFSYIVHVKNLLTQPKKDANEYFFPIIPESNLSSYFLSDDENELMGFEWDLDNGTTVCFEFYDKVLGTTQAEEFREIFCKLLYQVINKQLVTKSHKPEDYLSLCKYTIFIDAVLLNTLRDKSKEVKVLQPVDLSLLMKQMEQMQLSSISEASETSEIKTDSKTSVQIQEEHKYSEKILTKSTELKIDEIYDFKKMLGQASAEFIQINSLGSFIPIASDVQVSVLDFGNFDVRFAVTDASGKKLYSRVLTNELNYFIDVDALLFKWVDTSGDDLIIYGLKLKASASEARAFKFLIARCIVEHSNKESVEDLFKKDEIDYARRMLAEDVEKEDEEIYSNSSQEYEDDEMMIEDSYVKATSSVMDGKENTGHAQAKVLDRTFVSKGSTISVYQTDPEETAFDFICDLPIVKTFGGKEINPKKMLLHEQDSKMILLNPDNDRKVFYLDLEKGKVIEELGTEGENTIGDINSITKHSEFSTNPCFLALNSRNIFKMDPRIGGTNKIASQKIYAKAPKFSCIASTENEHFATGSELGEIRLFKEVGQNAKNLFPGLGDPIIGIDTTKDSKWLLATTKKYLILLPTVSGERNGYTHPLGKEKALPKKLQLSLEDICKNHIKEVNFTPAKFNDNKEGKEKFIVTSTGEFIVTWSFAQAVRGKTAKYEVKKIEDRVIMNEFRFNHDDSVLITTPNQVRIQKTSLASLKKYEPK